jgi:serine/threonine-protein kinase
VANESKKFSNLEGPERLIGSRVLEFELTAVLGSGGMSVVYRARHRVTHQEVAIKILPPELAIHDELKVRFVEEARVLALLEHPAIVALNNFCESGGRLCLIMQFVDGVTFEHKIVGAGKLPWTDVLRVGVEVLKALEYAHSHQVIHRDIKPSNILVRADGSVKVTDFGIAKILGASRLTGTGQTMGTVRYMSPEQVRGKTVDSRSDQYSLAVTLFEALAGRTPFEGENHFDIMQQHLNRRPPTIASFGAKVPAPVEKALLRALEKNPTDRFPDATAFRVALESALELANDPARMARERTAAGTRKIALALGAAVALAGAAGGGWLLWRKHREAQPATKPVAVVASKPAATPGAAPSWIDPHVVPDVILIVDEKFDADGLRVQASTKRDPAALRDRYRAILASLREFMRGDGELAASAGATVAPLTVVVVPQPVLEDAKRWPGWVIKTDMSYPSRYVAARRTLFIADVNGFERDELPYGVALHVLAPLGSLTNDRVLALAEKFEAYYTSKSTK